MIKNKRWKQFFSLFMVFALIFTNIAFTDIAIAKAASSSTEQSSEYLNETTKYLHLGSKDANAFDFDIKEAVKEKDAKYYWYINKDKGNSSAVAINSETGVVSAKRIGTAYIRCRVTLADGTIIRPEASVVVVNNITSVGISNISRNRFVTTGDTIDFNKIILDTEAGANITPSSITRWEVQEDTAGVGTPLSSGVVSTTKEGFFQIRAVCFQSTSNYNTWLKNKKANANLITATSKWSTITVVDPAHQAVVSTQKQLDKQLANKNIILITLATKSPKKFIIGKGDHLTKTLVVDVPNSDVDNYATFNNVIIEAIKDTTWIEYANGNIIYLDDTTSSIIIDENSEMKEIVIDRPNATINIIANGPIGKITLLQPSQVQQDLHTP